MAFQADSIFWVEVEKIVPNPFQPRREFDESKLKELSESVRMYGILQPLTVTRKEISDEDGAFKTEYELIAGERRLRASKLAGLAQVPVIIRESENSEQEKLELAIIENLQREDLNAVDRALAFQQLANAFNLQHAEVAKKVGRSREYVSNTIRLLQLPGYMLDSLKVADITEGHARTLLMLKDRPEEQDVVYREILLKKLSVREVERIVRKIATDKVRKQKWQDTDPQLIEYEKEFSDTLGTRVQIAKTDYGGKLTIDYFSDEDLTKLLEQFKQQSTDQAAAPAEVPVVQSMAAVTAATALEATEPEAVEPVERAETAVAETEAATKVEDEALIAAVAAEAGEDYTPREEVEVVEVAHAPPAEPAVAAETDGAELILDTAETTTAPSNSIRDQISRLLNLDQTHTPVAETPAAQAPTTDESIAEPADTEKKDEDDSDLYGVKNFNV